MQKSNWQEDIELHKPETLLYRNEEKLTVHTFKVLFWTNPPPQQTEQISKRGDWGLVYYKVFVRVWAI